MRGIKDRTVVDFRRTPPGMATLGLGPIKRDRIHSSGYLLPAGCSFLGFDFFQYSSPERSSNDRLTDQITVQHDTCIVGSVQGPERISGNIGTPFTPDSFDESFVGWHPEATWFVAGRATSEEEDGLLVSQKSKSATQNEPEQPEAIPKAGGTSSCACVLL